MRLWEPCDCPPQCTRRHENQNETKRLGASLLSARGVEITGKSEEVGWSPFQNRGVETLPVCGWFGKSNA